MGTLLVRKGETKEMEGSKNEAYQLA